jgi:hypothetical protein
LYLYIFCFWFLSVLQKWNSELIIGYLPISFTRMHIHQA